MQRIESPSFDILSDRELYIAKEVRTDKEELASQYNFDLPRKLFRSYYY